MRKSLRLLAVVLVAVVASCERPADAQLPGVVKNGLEKVKKEDAKKQPPDPLLERLRKQFTDPGLVLEMALVLVLAMLLGAAIAYHPLVRRKASTITEIEQPKTFILYALVGALVGHVVTIDEAMALVVFGIGGLLRFRTDVGEPKDTGRVILATIIGVCCGLGSFVIAVEATAIGWLLIWYLEGQTVEKLLVKGLEGEAIAAAEVAYREILESSGCKIIGVKKNFVKGQVGIVFRPAPRLDREKLEASFADVPKEHRGAVDWDMS